MAEETEQMIWYSDVWSRRFVVWIAGMNPAGAVDGQWSANTTKNFEPNLVQGSLIRNSNVDLQGSSVL